MNVTTAPASAGTGVTGAAPSGTVDAATGFAALLLGELAAALPTAPTAPATVAVATTPLPVDGQSPTSADAADVAAPDAAATDTAPQAPAVPGSAVPSVTDEAGEPDPVATADVAAGTPLPGFAPISLAAALLPVRPPAPQPAVAAPDAPADGSVVATAATTTAPVSTAVAPSADAASASPAPPVATAPATARTEPGTVPEAAGPVDVAPDAATAVDRDDQAGATPTTAPPTATTPASGGTTATPSAAAAPVQPAAPSTPSAVAMPVPRDPVTAQVLPVLARTVTQGEGVHRLVLRLHPLDLGEVRVTMTVRDGSVDVVLTAGAQARHHLSQGSSELRQMLETVGATAGQIVVKELAPAGSTTPAAPPAGATGSDLGAAADQGGRAAGHTGAGADRQPGRGPQHGPGPTGPSGPPEAPVPRRTDTSSTRSLDLTL